MTKQIRFSFLVLNEMISLDKSTNRARLAAILTWATLIEVIVKIGGIFETVHFFAELADKARVSLMGE